MMCSQVPLLEATLQHRASSSRDAQVQLSQVERQFDALQSVPYDVIGIHGRTEQVRVLQRIDASETQINTTLAAQAYRRAHA